MKIREKLFILLFAAEYERLQELALHIKNVQSLNWQLRDKLDRLPQPWPARFKLEGGLPEEEIAQRLGGTGKTPVMQAVVAHLGKKVVILCDRATDAPRPAMTMSNGATLAPFTEQERLHYAGQAAGVAEILAELQELTAAGEGA